MDNMIILLVEDNFDDELFVLCVLKKFSVLNQVVVVRDGQEVFDYVFGIGKYQDCDVCVLFKVVFLDLQLFKLNGIEVLCLICGDECIKWILVVLLMLLDEIQDMVDCYESGVNSYINKLVDFNEFVDQVRLFG